jgi:Uma2 family endonuclease
MGQIIEVIQRYEIPDLPEIDLPNEDGEPLESSWHRAQINLLIEILTYRWRERNDFFTAGNIFIYYSFQQIRTGSYKGPDFFLVRGVDSGHSRPKWVVWEEDGRYPDAIVELMSPVTRQEDLGYKEILYERTFKTRDYFCYDPETEELFGWKLDKGAYQSLEPDGNGRMWSGALEAWIGLWQGKYQHSSELWLRLFDEDDRLLPTTAEAERIRAERLAEKLRSLGVDPEE